MLTQIAKSPMSVCVDAETWQTYKSGIVGASCGTSVDHCVQAVGYKTGATNYWHPREPNPQSATRRPDPSPFAGRIVRNSWGTSWGNDGFIWVKEGINACAIASDATVTTGAKLV